MRIPISIAASIAAGCLVVAVSLPARGTLLTNGGLDDPAIHESNVATGWTLLEGPDSTDDSGGPVPTDTASFANFADRTADGRGLWLRSFVGGSSENTPATVFAHLVQVVPGVAGTPYQLSAWSYWELFYPSGVPSEPTQTLLALEFLDAANALLGAVQLDLAAEQLNDGTWRQHVLQGVAPAGTVAVQVRASMLDGVRQLGNPQSAFFDDFELVAIPEPGTLALALAGLAGLGARSRRSPSTRSD